jgi:hypothetical protein
MAIDKLQATRDGYEDDAEWQKFLLDSYVGSGGYQGRIRRPLTGFWGQLAQSYSVFALLQRVSGKDVDTYLDRHDKEDDEKFNRRKNVANYSNYVRAITNLKISYIERKPNKRNNLPDELAAWIEDSGYDKEMRRRMLVAAVLGWFPMLVDMPQRPADAQTAAQAGKLEPYTVLNLPVHLLDYELDDRAEFVWAKLKSAYTEKLTWDAEAVQVERYTMWTRATFEVWERRGESGDATQITPPTPHRFGQVPIIAWRADISVVDDVKADSMNADLVEKVRRLFNLESELDEHIRAQVFALLVWPGTAPAGNEGATVGTGNGLEISPEQRNVPFYLAPPASVAATLETRVEKTVVEIYRIGGVEYERPSGVRSSAPSKENEFSKTNAQIASIAKAIADADRRTLILVGRAMSIPEDKLKLIEVVPHESYADEALGDELEQAIQALTITLLGKLAKIELLKRLAQKLLPGMSADTWKTIQSEIEEAVEQEATDTELLKEQMTESGGGGGGGGGGSAGPGDGQTPEDELPADEGEVPPGQEAAE